MELKYGRMNPDPEMLNGVVRSQTWVAAEGKQVVADNPRKWGRRRTGVCKLMARPCLMFLTLALIGRFAESSANPDVWSDEDSDLSPSRFRTTPQSHSIVLPRI